jgi:Aldehyde dehydrogenase family
LLWPNPSLPGLYLHGLSKGDFELAVLGLLGDGAALPPGSIERLRGKWHSSAVFTRDRARGELFALRIEAGMTHINDHSVADVPTGPFGGEKNSGIGRFGGEWIIRELTRDHWITVRHQPTAYPF